MVLFTLVDGKKGPNDVLVLVTAYNEPLSFYELLFILKHYFDSEHSYYPVSEGYLGKGMLLSAVNCVAVGVPLDTILRKFQLDQKGKKLNIKDKRKSVSDSEKPIEKLHEILE